MIRHPYASALIAATFLIGCTSSQKQTTTPATQTNQTKDAVAKKAAPEVEPPPAPITGAQRACAVAAASPKAAPSQEVTDAIKADLEAMLRPSMDEEERFERLKKNWDVEQDMSAVLTVSARVSADGVRVDGVARSVGQVAEVLARLETFEWGKGGVWLLATRQVSAPEGGVDDAQSFTIFAGRYPAASNPYAALDTKACGPDAEGAKVDDAVLSDVTVRALDKGTFPTSDDPSPSVTTFPPRPKTKRASGDRLTMLRAKAHDITKKLTDLAELEASRTNEALFACAATMKGAKGFALTEDALRLTGLADAPTCEGVEAKKEGEDVVLRLKAATGAPAPTTQDIDAMSEAEVTQHVERLTLHLLIAQEKLPSTPALNWTLARMGNQMTTAGAKLVRVETRSWTPKDDVVYLRFDLGITGAPEDILEALGFLTRMTRINTIRGATFDATSGAPATVAFETYFYSPKKVH